jgi:hypothetical protein
MNANFGIVHSDVLPRVPDRKEQIVKRSLDFIDQWSKEND